MSNEPNTTQPDAPVLDATGRPVPGVDEWSHREQGRAWWATRVPATNCPHYIAQSEARAGYIRCERCPGPATAAAQAGGDPQ